MVSLSFTVLYSLIFLFLSAFFSASETALFSIPQERIHFFKQSKKKSHQWIFALLNDGQHTLLLILLGNLFVNVTVVHFLYKLIRHFYSENTTLITLFFATGVILLFGEVIPKNIAIRNSESLAAVFAPFLYHIKLVLHPVLVLLRMINVYFLTVFSRRLRQPSPYITLDEFKVSITDLMHRGLLTESESRIIQDILETGNIPVKQILTHRSQLLYITIEEKISKTISLMCEGEQTVCCIKKKSSNNEVAGFVYLSDALKRKNTISIKNIMVPAVQFIESNETASLIRVMFREGYKDVCIHDEFGAFCGTISLNKCIKYILNLTTVRPVPDIQGTVAQKFDGIVELQTIKDWIPPSLSQQAKSFRTLNGLLSSYLGRIPKKGEVFAIDEWSFYIIDSRLNRIESVLIKKEG